MADELCLSADDRAQQLPSGRATTFGNRVHWAKTYLGQAKLLEITRRGYFKVTPRGLQLLATNVDRIDTKFLGQFPEFREFLGRIARPKDSQDSPEEDDARDIVPSPVDTDAATPEERIDDAYEQITVELRTQLLDRIIKSPPAFFERVVIDLLVSMGHGGSRADAARRVG